MSLGIYMDVHVPIAISRGIDVLTAQQDGTAGWADPKLLDRALELGRILFTRDNDLLAEAKSRETAGDPHATVVYAHQLEVPIGTCVTDLELIAKATFPAEAKNHVVYLPLRSPTITVPLS